MGIRKMANSIMNKHFWIMQDFVTGKSNREIVESITEMASDNDDFEYEIFELGRYCLMKAGRKMFKGARHEFSEGN